jgi:hypothetical protein
MIMIMINISVSVSEHWHNANAITRVQLDTRNPNLHFPLPPASNWNKLPLAELQIACFCIPRAL